MAGIYIHIPFCKKACHYCNFHFSTTLTLKNELLSCIAKEIELQKNYLDQEPISSIYFGGGTPSLLSIDQINEILEKIYSNYKVNKDIEITFESNPDDLSLNYCKDLIKFTPINRLSIGIQSFQEDCLKMMNRAHNSTEAIKAIEYAQSAGYVNITIDLIYGTPTLSDELWQKNLEIAFGFDIPHLSCYNLTVEENTALSHFIKKGKQHPVDEIRSNQQFQILVEETSKKGYDHYEISNFAKKGFYAFHNSNYWNGIPYLGIGPAAHSFNGLSRQHNVANNVKYINSLKNDTLNFEKEILSEENIHNEYVMTSLRTIWGCDKTKISKKFFDDFEKKIKTFIVKGWVEAKGNTYLLTFEGKMFADYISSELFV